MITLKNFEEQNVAAQAKRIALQLGINSIRKLQFDIALFCTLLIWNTCTGQELELKKHPFFINTSFSSCLNEKFYIKPSLSFGFGIIKKDNHYLGINFSRYNFKGSANLNTFYYDARIGTHNPIANYYGYSKTIYTNLKYRCVSTGLFYAKIHQIGLRKALFYSSLNLMVVFPFYLSDISGPEYYYIVSSKPCLDFLIKYTIFPKKKKRNYFRISPTLRYNYISNINVDVYDNPWDRVKKLSDYSKHIILIGLSFELMNFYKKPQ